MNNRSWRGTVLFTVILVVMGATVGLKLYGVGQEAVSAPTSITSTPAAGTTGGATGGSTGGSTQAAPSTGSGSSTSSGSGSGSGTSSTGTRTITGSAVQTRYGAVQVQLTLSGGTITAVDTLQAPDGNGRDIAINQDALPILQQEVLQSQSADIDTVSGATYTSEGYKQSVQSALDQR
ncbi:FMN-binding protein [Leifsonia sp. F6_8S_P_1B]|uniref:FMN-binding protein n=1 Tax=Leifsonia williamsii TaxID=3035919 RepID=A0ABT8K943_9MICO|nr:FMN-binding protein [Leifsonia williamsii]MDN4612839.1 FMN-binding protein [Leifsonia williamsii]